LQRYRDFSVFQDGGHLPSCIFKIVKFYWLTGCGEPRCITMPNFDKIHQSVAELLQFFDFSRWQLLPSWIWQLLPSWIFKIIYFC